MYLLKYEKAILNWVFEADQSSERLVRRIGSAGCAELMRNRADRTGKLSDMQIHQPTGQSLKYSVIGRNTVASSAGSIHDDDVASTYGFKGGLVPGVNVLAHMCHLPLQIWGTEWLSEGSLDVRLQKPAYHEKPIDLVGNLDTSAEPEGIEIDAVSGGQICATGIAQRCSLGALSASWMREFEDTEMPTPEDRPVLKGSELYVGMPLGSIRGIYLKGEGIAFMNKMGECHDPFTNGDIAHPGILLAHTIYSCVWSFKSPVGIHAGCQMQFHNLLRDGMAFETRGRIAENYEYGANRFIEYDHVIISGSEVIISGRQRVVVEMGQKKQTI